MFSPGLGLSSTGGPELSGEENLLYQAKLTYSGRRHYLNLAARNDIHSYTFDLLAANIRNHHIGIDYNFTSNFKLGFYTQIIKTYQSDKNQRNLVFTSLYYNITSYPRIKTGLNYFRMGYDFKRSSLYFSPDKYQSFEVFFQVENPIIQNQKLHYRIMLSLGRQKIENQSLQATYRIEALLGYNISKTFDINIKYNRSNSSRSTVAGFQIDQIGLNLRKRLW